MVHGCDLALAVPVPDAVDGRRWTHARAGEAARVVEFAAPAESGCVPALCVRRRVAAYAVSSQRRAAGSADGGAAVRSGFRGKLVRDRAAAGCIARRRSWLCG